jgi:SAM-dependent methyltransferase
MIVTTLDIPLNGRVYELSSRGALFHFLVKQFRNLSYSEYFDDVAPGMYKGGIQCQDVQQLLVSDESFELVTSTEVFEHVPDDRKGFAEIYRVLKPGGHFVFTVPLTEDSSTQERVVVGENGILHHILPPEYHGDKLRGARNVLAFRNYGNDITEKLTNAGFTAEISFVSDQKHRIANQPVIVAHK